MNELFEKLYADISADGVQRTKGTETKKGYDTTGYGYQWAVDRFNEAVGHDWGYTWEIIKEQTGTYKSGAPFFDVTVRVAIWVESKDNPRDCVGGHISMSYADALKGAITNGFKKTAAFWGVGAAAYRGEIDDDNVPQKEAPDMTTAKPTTTEYKYKPPSQNRKTIEERKADAKRFLADNLKHLVLGKEEYFTKKIEECTEHGQLAAVAVEMKTAIEKDAQEALF